MRSINGIIIILALILIVSCGREDKNNEFVDDKTETNRQKTDSVKKESAPDTTGSPKNNSNSDKNTEDSYRQKFESEKPVAVISPLEAGDYNGKTVTVSGFVADIYQSEKVAYLNFVEKYPNNPFTAVIFARQFGDFPEIEKYRNKKVEVTGRVSMFKGKPQIILNSPDQLKMK